MVVLEWRAAAAAARSRVCGSAEWSAAPLPLLCHFACQAVFAVAVTATAAAAVSAVL